MSGTLLGLPFTAGEIIIPSPKGPGMESWVHFTHGGFGVYLMIPDKYSICTG